MQYNIANHRKTIPLYLQDNHYSSLDGFRAVSIIAVVYGHVYFNEDNLITQYFSGDWGVHFFFRYKWIFNNHAFVKRKE
jgi:hypothetical protein